MYKQLHKHSSQISGCVLNEKKFPKSPGLLYVIFGVYYIFKVEVVVVQLVGVPYFGAAVGILASNCAVC